MLKEAKKDAYDNLFIVAMFTGMRQGELLGLSWDNVKAVIERANIPSDVRFHDLRHSFAVTSLYSGDDVKTVQANLGHATAQFTLDVYGHVTQKMRQESAMRMQAFYNHLEV